MKKFGDFLDEVAEFHGLTVGQLCNPARCRSGSARRVAALVLRYYFRISPRSVANVLGYQDPRNAYHLYERATDADWNTAAMLVSR